MLSFDPRYGGMDEALEHLNRNKVLHYDVRFRIAQPFKTPLPAYIHVKGDRVRYRATVTDVVPFSRQSSASEKPKSWADAARKEKGWRHSLVMSEIAPYSRDTLSFRKPDGKPVKLAPRGYMAVARAGGAKAKKSASKNGAAH